MVRKEVLKISEIKVHSLMKNCICKMWEILSQWQTHVYWWSHSSLLALLYGVVQPVVLMAGSAPYCMWHIIVFTRIWGRSLSSPPKKIELDKALVIMVVRSRSRTLLHLSSDRVQQCDLKMIGFLSIAENYLTGWGCFSLIVILQFLCLFVSVRGKDNKVKCKM